MFFTAAALEAQACFALRAAEILVGLYAPEPQEKLPDFRLRVSRLVHELAIFLLPLGDVAATSAVKPRVSGPLRPCIQFARAFCIFEKKDIGDFLLCFRSIVYTPNLSLM